MGLLTPLDPSNWTAKSYAFRDGSNPAESHPMEQPATARRTWLVTPYTQRKNFIRWLLGETGGDTTVGISRIPPQRHPEYPDLRAVRVPSVKGLAVPQADDGTKTGPYAGVKTVTEYEVEEPTTAAPSGASVYKYAPRYSHAVVEAEYEHLRYATQTDADTEWSTGGLSADYDPINLRNVEVGDPRGSAEHLQLPGLLLKYTRPGGWPGGAVKPIQYGAGMILPLQEFDVWWRRVPAWAIAPGSEWFERVYGSDGNDPYIGRVNKYAAFGRRAGTLLLASAPEIVRRDTPAADGWEYDVKFPFAYDPNGWNVKYYFDPAGADSGWYYVSKSGTYHAPGDVPNGDSLYNTGALVLLFLHERKPL